MSPRESECDDSSRYDYESDKWVPQCPYGDVCTGCDAAGRCSRVEPTQGEGGVTA